MSDEVGLINEYNAWVVEQRRKDISPEAFVIDRAKEQALERLIRIEEEVDAYFAVDDWEDTQDELTGSIGSLEVIRDIVKE